MTVGRADKMIDSGVMEKIQGIRRGWKWGQKIYGCRRALDDDNNNGNEEDKGWL